MSLFFLLNNFHFTLELIGALIFLVIAWLAFDTFSIKKDREVMLRGLGFAIPAVFQALHAFGFTADWLGYSNQFLYIAGLSLVLASFVLSKPVVKSGVPAVLILPAAAAIWPASSLIAACLLGGIAYFARKQEIQEFNKGMHYFWIGFAILAVGALLSAVSGLEGPGLVWSVGHMGEALGFFFLGWWAWQYLQLRIKEQMILIFVSMALLLATVVTLAFSTILITRVETEAKGNLLTNAKVLAYAIERLQQESLAKAGLLATRADLRNAIVANDFRALEKVLTKELENQKLGFLTVTDNEGIVILRAHSLTEKSDDLSKENAVSGALRGTPTVTIETSSAENLSIRAAAPVLSGGRIIGLVVAGFPLDNALVDNINRITGLEMSIFDKDSRVATTALNPDGRTRSTGIKITDPDVLRNVLAEGKFLTVRTEILSRPFLASYLPLYNSDQKIVGMLSAAQPQQEILEIANATNRLTFLSVAILILLLIAPIYFLTKRLMAAQG